MLMDLKTNIHTDFVLSNKAFKAVAKPGKDRDIFKLGIADVNERDMIVTLNKSITDFVLEPKFLYQPTDS
ncbi:Expansin-like A1 [Bienertia sinuspersici]